MPIESDVSRKKKSIIVTGMSGMMGVRFQELYGDQYILHNFDLNTGVDITDSQSVVKKASEIAPDAIIHLAAFTDVTQAHLQAGDTNGLCYRVNVDGTKSVIEAVAQLDCHLVYISTDYVFDGEKESPYVETDIPNPIEWYGETKFLAEQMILQHVSSFTILRPTTPYSAHPVREDFLAKTITALLDNSLPPQFVDRYVTPTFVDDLSKLFSISIEKKPQGIYHAVGSSWHNNYEISCMINDVFDLGGIVKKGYLDAYLKTAVRPYQRSLKLSNEKLVEAFCIKPLTFHEGLLTVRQQLDQVAG